jgi:hypothetical protein
MKVIQTIAEIGEDRTLCLRLPEDTPVGPIEVLVVLEARRVRPSLEERRAAARAGRGALAGSGVSTAELLAERKEDERRRQERLGR